MKGQLKEFLDFLENTMQENELPPGKTQNGVTEYELYTHYGEEEQQYKFVNTENLTIQISVVNPKTQELCVTIKQTQSNGYTDQQDTLVWINAFSVENAMAAQLVFLGALFL